MRQVGPINCTPTAMFERPPNAPQKAAPLDHAAELAHWVILLLGWLWLGEKGTLVAWPWVNGVLLVALWWAVRVVCRGRAWVLKAPPKVLGLLGLLTASGLACLGRLNDPLAAQGLLLCLAGVWGLWCAMVETRSPSSAFQMGGVAWHPLLAAVLVGFFKEAPVPMVLCAAVGLYGRDRASVQRPVLCRGTRAGFSGILASSAMGLMMGGLCFGHAWCASAGWSLQQMIAAHLALMAGLPAVLACLQRWFQFSLHPASAKNALDVSLPLQALGALMLWGDSFAPVALAMLLPSLAWAVHCVRPRPPGPHNSAPAPGVKTLLALLLGPVLLLAVGAASVVHGPLAMRMALAFLGVLAGFQWLIFTWLKQAPLAANPQMAPQ